MALVEAAVVPDPPQRPPDRLDVVVVHRHVGVVEIEPEADPLGEPVPVLDVAEDRLAAALVELGDPVVLDLGLRGDPQLLLDLELDRQPVAVPARLARHQMPGHGPVAGIDVLEDAREDVVGAGPAVGGRRTLVEAPQRRPLALGDRARERRRARASARAPAPRARGRTASGLRHGIPPSAADSVSRASPIKARDAAAQSGRVTEPSSSIVQRGLWATSQGWPAGSMKIARVAAPEGLARLAADRRSGLPGLLDHLVDLASASACCRRR